ncbi:hypothetical protein [Deinococcus radiophilus]|uniref:hypothetical protein n=1 Tax=Deinococcus radiophilus TaxID=32062 RepID=UPI00362397AD
MPLIFVHGVAVREEDGPEWATLHQMTHGTEWPAIEALLREHVAPVLRPDAPQDAALEWLYWGDLGARYTNGGRFRGALDPQSPGWSARWTSPRPSWPSGWKTPCCPLPLPSCGPPPSRRPPPPPATRTCGRWPPPCRCRRRPRCCWRPWRRGAGGTPFAGAAAGGPTDTAPAAASAHLAPGTAATGGLRAHFHG